jgi:hypothetical protein
MHAVGWLFRSSWVPVGLGAGVITVLFAVGFWMQKRGKTDAGAVLLTIAGVLLFAAFFIFWFLPWSGLTLLLPGH